MWPRPVDSGKVQIMDLEKRICLERVKFKRGQVDKITDALSVLNLERCYKKCKLITLIQTHAATHHN